MKISKRFGKNPIASSENPWKSFLWKFCTLFTKINCHSTFLKSESVSSQNLLDTPPPPLYVSKRLCGYLMALCSIGAHFSLGALFHLLGLFFMKHKSPKASRRKILCVTP